MEGNIARAWRGGGKIHRGFPAGPIRLRGMGLPQNKKEEVLGSGGTHGVHLQDNPNLKGVLRSGGARGTSIRREGFVGQDHSPLARLLFLR